ncbi:MAG: hypothetical protein IJB96_03370, partial [Lachnospira sp.]|nr:hypothetical protein [Lachnospira sp.]
MKRTIKKLSAIVMAIVVLAGIMPFVGLDGVFKFSPITVMAADVSPFDTAHFAVTGTGNYKGVSWTTFEHGLLWVG